MSTQLRIRLLGDLQVLRDGRPLELPQSRKARALLGYLVVRGVPERRERLCELIWDGPSDPRAALRWSLTKLRELIDDGDCVRIVADRERVGFEPNGVDVDLLELRARLKGDSARASTDDLRAAAELLSGELLAGLDLRDSYAFAAWLAAERDVLRRARTNVLTALVARLRDQPLDALAFARQRIAADPFDDDAHASVIELLGSLGRVREAAEAYDECRRVLKRELGREPNAAVERARTRAARGTDDLTPTAKPDETAIDPRRPPLVGRREELVILRELLSSDRANALIVTGEPGIGKSRLLQELNALATREGGTVLAGRAFEAEMIRPYGPWIDALQSLFFGATAAAARNALTAKVASALSVLLPELASSDEPRENDLSAGRNRLFAAVAELLQSLARTAGPVVVALDDLQWFDDSSLALLHYVARSTRETSDPRRKIVIAITGRAHELASRASPLTVVRALRREGATRDIALGALSAEDVTTLASFVDGTVDASRVAAASEGNPLFALEVARNLSAGKTGVPSSLEAIIDDRLARLGPTARDVVVWAAALAGAFTPRTLANVGKFDDGALFAALEELELAGVIRGQGPAYEFSHDLICRVAYNRMAAPRAAAVHLAIAQRLAAIDDPIGDRSSDVATHALLGGDFVLAARAFARAADRSIRVFALIEASALASRGLSALESAAARLTIAPNDRVTIAVSLYSSFVQADGARGSEDDVRRALERLAADARALQLHAAAQTAFYLISYIHFFGGEWSAAAADTHRAVEAGRAAGNETAVRSLANSGRCLASIERDLPLAEQFLREAAEGADALGIEIVDLPWGLGILAHHRGDCDEAVSWLERTVAIARSRGELWPLCDCLVRLASLELERDRYDAVRAYCADLAPFAAKLGDGSERTLGVALDALALLRSDDDATVRQAQERLQSALDELAVLDAKGARSYALLSAAEWHWSNGRGDVAAALAREALGASSAVGRKSEMAMARILLARSELAAGRTSQGDELAALVEADAAIPRALSARALVWRIELQADRTREQIQR